MGQAQINGPAQELLGGPARIATLARGEQNVRTLPRLTGDEPADELPDLVLRRRVIGLRLALRPIAAQSRRVQIARWPPEARGHNSRGGFLGARRVRLRLLVHLGDSDVYLVNALGLLLAGLGDAIDKRRYAGNTLDNLDGIANDPDLPDAEKREAFRRLGIEDEGLITALLTL